jgi:hypothetical protein
MRNRRTTRWAIEFGMRNLIKVLRLTARVLVAAQIVLGLLIWFGKISLTQAHIGIGSLFVLDLWALGIIALFALSARGLSLLTLLMGGLIMWLGVAQTTLLVGPAHWAIRILHLLLGISAMGLVEPLTKALLAHYAERADQH